MDVLKSTCCWAVAASDDPHQMPQAVLVARKIAALHLQLSLDLLVQRHLLLQGDSEKLDQLYLVLVLEYAKKGHVHLHKLSTQSRSKSQMVLLYFMQFCYSDFDSAFAKKKSFGHDFILEPATNEQVNIVLEYFTPTILLNSLESQII